MVEKRIAEDCHLLVFLDACYKELVYCLLHVFRKKKSSQEYIFTLYFYSLKSLTLLKDLNLFSFTLNFPPSTILFQRNS